LEIAIKSCIGKLDFPDEVLVKAIHDLELTVLSHTAAHARKLYGVPAMKYFDAESGKAKAHWDPFDRALIAVALAEGIPMLTTDAVFCEYKPFGLELVQG
jgi:PIN domain nuclease of toxin-antitoxin system